MDRGLFCDDFTFRHRLALRVWLRCQEVNFDLVLISLINLAARRLLQVDLLVFVVFAKYFVLGEFISILKQFVFWGDGTASLGCEAMLFEFVSRFVVLTFLIKFSPLAKKMPGELPVRHAIQVEVLHVGCVPCHVPSVSDCAGLQSIRILSRLIIRWQRRRGVVRLLLCVVVLQRPIQQSIQQQLLGCFSLPVENASMVEPDGLRLTPVRQRHRHLRRVVPLVGQDAQGRGLSLLVLKVSIGFVEVLSHPDDELDHFVLLFEFDAVFLLVVLFQDLVEVLDLRLVLRLQAVPVFLGQLLQVALVSKRRRLPLALFGLRVIAQRVGVQVQVVEGRSFGASVLMHLRRRRWQELISPVAVPLGEAVRPPLLLLHPLLKPLEHRLRVVLRDRRVIIGANG